MRRATLAAREHHAMQAAERAEAARREAANPTAGAAEEPVAETQSSPLPSP